MPKKRYNQGRVVRRVDWSDNCRKEWFPAIYHNIPMFEYSDGYVRFEDGQYVHRIVFRNNWGYIPREWVVHHINAVKTDQRPENLIALPDPFHNLIHKWIKENGFLFNREQTLRLLEEHVGDYDRVIRKQQAELDQIKRDYGTIINRYLELDHRLANANKHRKATYIIKNGDNIDFPTYMELVRGMPTPGRMPHIESSKPKTKLRAK